MMSVRFICSAVIRGLSINDLARVECVLDSNDAAAADDEDNDCCVFAVKCR